LKKFGKNEVLKWIDENKQLNRYNLNYVFLLIQYSKSFNWFDDNYFILCNRDIKFKRIPYLLNFEKIILGNNFYSLFEVRISNLSDDFDRKLE
jgi:hypothetical protein